MSGACPHSSQDGEDSYAQQVLSQMNTHCLEGTAQCQEWFHIWQVGTIKDSLDAKSAMNRECTRNSGFSALRCEWLLMYLLLMRILKVTFTEETGSKVKVGHKSQGLGGHGRFDTS